jgi:hypothetical protein
MASGGAARPAALLFDAASLSFCLNASSRRISSSMRLENRYLRIHFPRLTANVSVADFNGEVSRTSLVLPELHRLLQDQLIGIHLGIKTVVRLQHNSQVS